VSIEPELYVRRGREAVEFYEEAFGAVVLHRVGEDEIVAQLAVGDARFWVHDGDTNPEAVGASTVRLLLVVDDPSDVASKAVAAGAAELSPVAEEHGWFVGRIRDPFGHHWEIGRPLVEWPPPA
jgi:PhnB protein